MSDNVDNNSWGPDEPDGLLMDGVFFPFACPECDGHGTMVYDRTVGTCRSCDGSGRNPALEWRAWCVGHDSPWYEDEGMCQLAVCKIEYEKFLLNEVAAVCVSPNESGRWVAVGVGR